MVHRVDFCGTDGLLVHGVDVLGFIELAQPVIDIFWFLGLVLKWGVDVCVFNGLLAPWGSDGLVVHGVDVFEFIELVLKGGNDVICDCTSMDFGAISRFRNELMEDFLG